jgi:hypothetical protein
MMMTRGPPSAGRDALARASELPSPAPRDHFLYLFGASDREVVDASSREPNVGQVLSLMNGFVQSKLVNSPAPHLYKCLTGRIHRFGKGPPSAYLDSEPSAHR